MNRVLFYIIELMTNDELIVKAFKTIKEQTLEEKAETESNTKISQDLKEELLEDYEESLDCLDVLIPQITSVESLYQLEEDEFCVAVEFLENYAEVFIIDGRDEKLLKETEAEYDQFQDILFELYDEFDDEDDEDLD